VAVELQSQEPAPGRRLRPAARALVLAFLGLMGKARCYLSRLRNQRMRGIKIRDEVA
jgi:hypothetical protein